MHSSYALASENFAVERDGSAAPLDTLWPGGFQPGDRLGVLLAQPMDAIGCSNLICGTITLFYDRLRETLGTGNFFRYSDVYVFGVGCEPGDYNQLDVWPLHKFVTILQPTTEAVLEAVNDRRITLLALPETGVRCRGEVVLSTWNAYLATVRSVLTYSPRTGRARGGDVALVGNRVVESYVEQAIFSTPGVDAGQQARLRRLRRALDRQPLQSVETYRTLRGPAATRALLGLVEVLPPGHQELSRRAGPTVILPVEVALPTTEAESVPLSAAGGPDGSAADVVQPLEWTPGADTLLRTPFDTIQRRYGGRFAEWEGWDWISDFGDPLAEHHAVREAVGVWDESPLRKWAFVGPDALAAADFLFTNDMSTLQVGQVRYGAFCDERGRMLGDGTVLNGGDGPLGILAVTALESDGDHFRQVCAGRFDVEIVERTAELPHVQVQGPRSRELLAALTDAPVADLRYFRFLPEPVTVGGVAGCYISRTGYSGELGYEVFCPPAGAEALFQALLDQGGSLGIRPYGLAAVESIRIESGLIFIGYDYIPGVTSPFHVNLDFVVKLEAGDFLGRDALRAELQGGVGRRMVTLVIAGDEAPDYGSTVLSHGRGVGRLTSPSAGRSPSVDRVIGLAVVETEVAEVGTRLEVALPDGRTVPATVAGVPIHDPDKQRPRA